MTKENIFKISALTVLIFVFAMVFSINTANACDYCGYQSYDYGYSNYSYSNYGYGYGDCGYYGGCTSSYSAPYQFQQYPEIVYIPNQNNTGYSTPYQFQRFPEIVYVPHNQSGTYNPYNNTTATSNSLYYQGSQIQYSGNYSQNYNTNYGYNYNYGYGNNYGYGSNYNYLYNQGGGQFIRTN